MRSRTRGPTPTGPLPVPALAGAGFFVGAGREGGLVRVLCGVLVASVVGGLLLPPACVDDGADPVGGHPGDPPHRATVAAWGPVRTHEGGVLASSPPALASLPPAERVRPPSTVGGGSGATAVLRVDGRAGGARSTATTGRSLDGPPGTDLAARAGRLGAPSTAPPRLHA